MADIQKLKELKSLLDSGVLTEAEFQREKTKVLNGPHGVSVKGGGVPGDAAPSALPTDEIIYLETSKLKVSSLEVVIGNDTFATQNISSVGLGDDSAETLQGRVYIACGGVASMAFFYFFESFWFFIGGILMFGLAFLIPLTYCVRIRGGGGETDVLKSTNKKATLEVIGAIQSAIKTRY